MTEEVAEAPGAHDHCARTEWMLTGVVIVLGGLLRILFIDSFHVEHFDEGVYASNRWFLEEEGARYPDRHLYAPPLWPAVLEYSQLLLGPTSLGVMLPGILLGALSIGLLWKLVQSWVGRDEALLVAGMLAVSGYHILFSRTALTDVPVTALMLGGIGLLWSSLSRSCWRTAVVAGFITGLAWSVKYNGWFPLAVSGAGLVAATLFHVKHSGMLWKQWGCWSLTAVVAGAVWFPSWWDLQSPERGGYAAVAANHAGYVRGWDTWLEHLRLQFENLAWFDNQVVFAGFWVLIFAFMTVRFRAARSRSADRIAHTPANYCKTSPDLAVVAGIYLVAGCMGLGFSLPRLLFSLALLGGVCRLIRLLHFSRQGASLTPRILAGWMMLVWFASLVLVTPLYHPYPRLAMPLYLAVLVGTAFGLQELRGLWRAAGPESIDGRDDTYSVSRGTRYCLVSGAVICVLLGHALVGPRIDPHHNDSPWQSRLSMETGSQQIVDVCNSRSAERLSRPVAYVLYVYGEPALFYHLCRLAPENVVVAPVSNLGFLNAPPGREPVPIYLVAGPHTVRNPDYEQQREAAGERLAHVVDAEVEVSDLLLLNARTAREVADSIDDVSKVTIELFEMQPSVADAGE